MTSPQVSVLLPVRDHAAVLGGALGSLWRQTLRQIEVVVVDDGSVDGTARLLAEQACEEPRLRVVRQARQGIVAALNRAARRARADLLARMDADDLAHPERLEAQRALLVRHADLAAVGTLVRPRDGRVCGPGWARYLDWLNGCVSSRAIARELLVESPLAHPSVMMRRQAFEAVGGYRDFDGPEDYDLWLRLALAGGRFAKVPRVLLDWADNPDRLTRRDRRYRTEAFVRLKAQYLARGPLSGLQRPVVLWGAGRVGRMLGRALEAEGVRALAYLDIDPRKIGRTRRGAPVWAPAALADEPSAREAVVLAAVPVAEARALIRRYLEQLGRVEGRDFWVCA